MQSPRKDEFVHKYAFQKESPHIMETGLLKKNIFPKMTSLKKLLPGVQYISIPTKNCFATDLDHLDGKVFCKKDILNQFLCANAPVDD